MASALRRRAGLGRQHGGGVANERAQLTYDRRVDLLTRVLASFSSRNAAVTTAGASLGPPLIIDAAELFTDAEQDVLRRRRSLATTVRGMVNAAAARGLRRIRDASRPTYRTGLFLSAWRSLATPDASGLNLRRAFTNPTPYAGYVHRRGTSRKATVVNVHIRPIVAEVADELATDLQPIQRIVAREVQRERAAGLL